MSNDVRVFVSSTVYDLVDLRSELKVQLDELGVQPVMSEYDLGTADAPPADNTIEQCRLEVERADIVLCIVSRRYGPTLEKFIHPDRSATHVEWDEAIRLGKRRRLFVRDSVLAAYSLWKHASKDGPDAPFSGYRLKESDARGIFRMVRASEEPQSHTERRISNEWVVPFKDSADLRRQVVAYLRRASDRLVLAEGLAAGTIPRLVVTATPGNFTERDGRVHLSELRVRVDNPSKSPLFQLRLAVGEQAGELQYVVSAGGGSTHPFRSLEVPLEGHVAFETAAGLRVRYVFEIGAPGVDRRFETRVLRLELVDRRTFQVGGDG